MVITGVAPPPGSHLVYLCALIPDVGDTTISMGSRHPGGIDTILAEDDEGDLVLRGELLDDILWADAPPELAARARATLRTQSIQTFLDPPERLAWKTTPSTLVIGRHDRVFGRGLIQETARRATTVLEWNTSHSPVLSRPDLVADLLVELATPR
jgi:pimeloyl-ACP methyl ester carboxylesterase